VNPYALLAIIALSTSILAGTLVLLVSLGISLLLSIIGVYSFIAMIMVGMQKSAARLYDGSELAEQGERAKDQFCTDQIFTDQIFTEAPIISPIKRVCLSSSNQSQLFKEKNEQHSVQLMTTTSTDSSAVK